MSLIEINLYPYLTWFFYGCLFLIILKFRCYDEKLFYIFIISLIFTRSFLIFVIFEVLSYGNYYEHNFKKALQEWITARQLHV